MGLPDLSTAAFLRVLRRMQGRGGWSNEDGSRRVRELEAVATAASDGAQLIAKAGLAAFPASDVDGTLLTEWERELAVVEDFPISDAERRARLAAYRTLVDPTTRPGLIRILETFTGAIGSIEELSRATREEIERDPTVEPEAIFVTRLSVSGLANEQHRIAMARALLRHLPARMIPRAGLDALRHEMGDDAVMSWGGGDLQSEHLLRAPWFAPQHNLLGPSVGWSGAAGGTVVTTGVADPLGGTDAVTLTDDSSIYAEYAVSSAGPYIDGAPLLAELWVQENPSAAPTTHATVHLAFDGVINFCSVRIYTRSGEVVPHAGNPPVTCDSPVAGWWRVRFRFDRGAPGSTVFFWVYPSQNPSGTGSITIYRPHISIAHDRRYGLVPSRVRSFAPFGRVTADDLDAIAQEIQWRGGRGGLSNSSPGGIYRIVALELSTSKDVDVDDSVDWRNRFVRINARASTSDIRPGALNDTMFNDGALADVMGWTTSGGSASEIAAGSVTFYVDATTGKLKAKTVVGGAFYVVALVWATGIVTSGSGDDIDAVAFDTMWSTTKFGELLETHFTKATQNQPTWSKFQGRGGLHRFGFVVNLPIPTSGETRRVLDASIDWRDRIISVSVASDLGPYGVVPGANDAEIRGSAVADLGYTGTGATGGGSLGAYETRVSGSDAVTIYADDATGHLMLSARSGIVAWDAVTIGLIVHATPQIGQRSDPVPIPSVPNNPAYPCALDLHILQDGAVMQQFRGSRADLLFAFMGDEHPTTPSDAYPLGPICSGSPRVPVVWTTRERIGERVDFEDEHRREVRQTMAGTVRFPFAVECPVGVTVVDDVADWRDRLLSAVGRTAATDRRPGGADAANHNASTAYARVLYTGLGADPLSPADFAVELTTNVRIAAHRYTGELVIVNGSGATVYVTGMVEATPQLGPRSS